MVNLDKAAATPPLPAEYYRRHAARVRELARNATTPAIQEHLRGVAREYEQLAERVNESGSSAADTSSSPA